jgi:hypothetical protein
MKKAILTLMLLAIATVAFSQVDPDENGFGLYFDQLGNDVCLSTTAPFTPVTAYLLLTNPTSVGASGFECEVVVNGNLTAPAWTLNGSQPLNIATAPEFMVGFGTGDLAVMASDNVALLATMTAYIMAPTDQIGFQIAPYAISSFDPAAPGYADANNAGILVAGQVSSGFPYTNDVAQINTDPCSVVANDNVSFGSLKALYR